MSAVAETNSEALLLVNNIEVIYDHVILVLKGVSLEVMEGGVVALLGANGAGKSTTLKAISNLLGAERGDVTKGTITFKGEDVHSLTPNELVRRGVIQVMEGRHCFEHLTVEENLQLGLEALPGGLAKHKKIDELVYELFPVLKQFLARKGGDLSGGQQQQLAIARALLGKPKLLLLDEPTEGIQPNIVQDIESAVKRIISETGVGVLLVEQHLHFVRQADRYYAMQRGGIVANGPTSELSKSVVEKFLSV